VEEAGTFESKGDGGKLGQWRHLKVAVVGRGENAGPQGLLIPAKELSLRRPYRTPYCVRGIPFPHAEARG
jgi:hypothetical protein